MSVEVVLVADEANPEEQDPACEAVCKMSLFLNGQKKIKSLWGAVRGTSCSKAEVKPVVRKPNKDDKPSSNLQLAPGSQVQPSPAGIGNGAASECPKPPGKNKDDADKLDYAGGSGTTQDSSSVCKDDMPAFLQTLLAEQCKVKPWIETDFQLVSQLQEAVRNHGCVNLMKRLKDGKMVAAKRMPTKWVTSSHPEFRSKYPTSSELPWMDIGIVRYLGSIGYPYVCEFFNIFDDGTKTYVVTSLASEGDLFKWCDIDIKPGPIREEKMRPVVAQVFAAVRWLHDLNIVHRDLSLENILVDDGRVKLIDFGMSTFERYNVETRGKLSYQAPEMHVGEYDGFLTDAFAIGVIIFGMACQDYPWTSTKPDSCQLYAYVQANGFHEFLKKRKARKDASKKLSDLMSPDFCQLLEGLVSLGSGTRWTLGEKCFEDCNRRNVWQNSWLGEHGAVAKVKSTSDVVARQIAGA